MKIMAASLPSVVVYGCAIPTTGVVPRRKETFDVTRQGNEFWVTTESLNTAAIQGPDANHQLGAKSAKVIQIKKIPACVVGRWLEYEFLFRFE